MPFRTERKVSTSTVSAILEATERCARCNKVVYMAEKVIASSQVRNIISIREFWI